jgi:hypothetical protein
MRAGWPSAQYGRSGSRRNGSTAAAGVDAAAQVVELGPGELPVKWPGSGVVTVLEGQQAGGEGAAVTDVRGLDYFALDDGKDDYLEPGGLWSR